MPLKSQSISIVIPCYNEEKAIEPVLQKFVSFQGSTRCSIAEIIIVNDGSTDGTSEIIKKFPFVTAITNNQRNGYGASLKQGFAIAKGDFILFLDMDDTYQFSDLDLMYENLLNKDVEIVFGNRLLRRSGMPTLRFLGNKFYYHCLQILQFPNLMDPCTGMRLFRKKWVSEFCQISENNFSYSISLSLFILQNNISYSEVEINYQQRVGESKLNSWFDGWRFLWTILRSRA